MKLEAFRQIIEKYSNVKFHKHTLVGAELFLAARRIDRHDKTNSHFPQILRKNLKKT